MKKSELKEGLTLKQLTHILYTHSQNQTNM